MTDAATRAQNIAADPGASTWLSANAGSGKTRVLTNRVARLLLHGVQPQNILCLTYTKAAASEMQNRLFQTLGAWAMLDESSLRTALQDLGEDPPADLSRARTLFARAIEAPGGLKIQTIHSLCSSILRQFPLEARVSPQFREMDEPAQRRVLTEVLDALALAGEPALAEMARYAPGDDLVPLAADIAKRAPNFARTLTRREIFEGFGVPQNRTADEIVGMAFGPGDLDFLRSLAPQFARGGKTDVKNAARLAALGLSETIEALLEAADILLTGDSANAPFTAKIGSLPTKDLRESAGFAPFRARLETIMQNVEAARAAWVNYDAACRTAALHAFAQVFLPGYEQAKEDQGLVDFDDLIRKTAALLSDRTLAWVLYRLDSRIEHILVDEAQDTSPAQWEVIRALAAELTAGESDTGPRTIFVVGDKKQSIYSFQGADAAGFDRMAGDFGRQLGDRLRERQLLHSFRSSPAILGAVDAVMANPEITGVGDSVLHAAFHERMPGRVDLWALEPAPDKPDTPEWYMPVDRQVENAASEQLARRLAASLKRMLESETIPDKNGKSRPIRPGDIMILVRGRGGIFEPLIRACKALDLPIAGADRLRLAAEMAVRDLTALLSFLALPDDSLNLAAALKSPLFGWSESDLFHLAARRTAGTLWEELRNRRDAFPETWTTLSDLRDLVDFRRPYELIEAILTRHGGRSRLLAHIGPEAEEGIDELLNQALAYETAEVPSLTGFLAMLQGEEITVKRQADGSDDLIRVMTVHGAKGLERPVVILPDTTSAGQGNSSEILVDEDGMPVPPISKALSPARVATAKDARQTADADEMHRLLYVAMTRAESWLIVCGTEQYRSPPKARNWHKMIAEGLTRAGGVEIDTPDGPVTRLQHGDWQRGEMQDESAEQVTNKDHFADFLTNAAPPAPPAPRPLSPSRLGGAKVLGGGALDEEAALRRGRQVHLLLEHLPGAAEPRSLARALLSHGPDRADADQAQALADEALAALAAHPALFGPEALAEVGLAAHVPGLTRPVQGTIDRLIVAPDHVLAVDFKTNAIVPDDAADTPEGILRQMGAYLSALEGIYPGREIRLAILWTASGRLMTLPHGIVREALGRTPTS